MNAIDRSFDDYSSVLNSKVLSMTSRPEFEVAMKEAAAAAATIRFFPEARRPLGPWIAALTLVLATFAVGQVAAAEKFKEGDEIEVYFLNEWRPAVVVEVGRRGEVMAEFEFVKGSPQRRVFRGAELRPAYESGALMPTRIWSDASGKFKITAALIAVDKGSITLRKPDKTEVTVAIDKLAPADQELLKKMQKAVLAEKGPEPPPLEEFARDESARSSAGWDAAVGRALEADPLPSYLNMQQGGVLFGTDDLFDRMGAVLPVGGPDAWLIAGVENENLISPRPARVIWASLAKKQIASQHLLPPNDTIVDYHAPSKQLLTSTKSRIDLRREEVLTLWRTSPNEKELTPIVRWNAGTPGNDHPTFDHPWARIVDADTVVVRAGKNDVLGWSIGSKRLKFRLNQESFFAPPPVLSAGRRYLAIPEDLGVRVYEAATGEILATYPSANGVAGVAFDETGRRLAFVGRNLLKVVDVTTPQAPIEDFQAEAIATPFQTNLEWLDGDRLLADSLGGRSKVMFSLKHRLPLWNYEFDWNAVHDEKGKRFRHIVAGHLVYAATMRESARNGLVVGAVKLPGPKVDEADASLDPESLYFIKRGTAVKANIQAGAYGERVWTAVKAMMERNGWVYDPNSPITVTAEMKQAAANQVTYVSTNGATQTVTVQPFISSLRIEVGKDVAWMSASASGGAPPTLRLGQGQTIQDEINLRQVPQPEFFERVVVPEKIVDPQKRNGLGTTDVTNRGLIPREK